MELTLKSLRSDGLKPALILPTAYAALKRRSSTKLSKFRAGASTSLATYIDSTACMVSAGGKSRLFLAG